MRLCRIYQIPHGHLLGGPNSWSQLDVDKAVAYERLEMERCPQCKTLEEDWTEPVPGDLVKRRPLQEPLWAAVTKHCFGCDELERLKDFMDKQVSSHPNRAKPRGMATIFVPFDELDDWED